MRFRVCKSTTLHISILLCCFFVGSVSGCVLASLGLPHTDLASHLSDYILLSANREVSASVIATYFSFVRWPLAVIIAAFTPFVFLAVPILMLLRGFFLAYTITCFSVLLGSRGLTVAILLFSTSLLFELPALFVFSCEAFCFDSSPVHTGSETHSSFHLGALLLGIALLALATTLQLTTIPDLLSAVCARLST